MGEEACCIARLVIYRGRCQKASQKRTMPYMSKWLSTIMHDLLSTLMFLVFFNFYAMHLSFPVKVNIY